MSRPTHREKSDKRTPLDDSFIAEIEALKIRIFLLDRNILGLDKTYQRRALVADIDRALMAQGVPVEPAKWTPIEEIEELKAGLLADRVVLVDRYASLKAASMSL